MNEEELNSIQELIERKLLMVEVMGGLTSQDKKFINLWNYAMQLQNNWNELKKFIEKELDRLARECSQIYEDSLGKTRLVNEDIYNEVKNISNKVQELEGNNDSKRDVY